MRKVSGARHYSAINADNAKALGFFLLGSRAHVKRTRRLHARFAYVMRVDDRARVTYAAATPAVQKSLAHAKKLRQSLTDNAKL
jgi:hypothetical protein